MGRPMNNDSAKKYQGILKKKSRLFALNLTPTLWLSHTWNTVVVGAGHPVPCSFRCRAALPIQSPSHAVFGIGFYGTWTSWEARTRAAARDRAGSRVPCVGVTVQGIVHFRFCPIVGLGSDRVWRCVKARAEPRGGDAGGGALSAKPYSSFNG